MAADHGNRAAKRRNAVDVHVGSRLALARSRLGETPANVATALNVSLADYYAFENGDKRLGAEALFSASTFLKQHPAWFFQELATCATERVDVDPEVSASCETNHSEEQ